MKYEGKFFGVFSKQFTVAPANINPILWGDFHKLNLVCGDGGKRAQKSPP